MIRKIDVGAPQVVAYDIDDTITTDEVRAIHDDLRSAIENEGAARLFMDVRDLGGAEPRAIVEDLKLTPEYVEDVERYAVVGDERWQDWLTQAAGTITRGEARFFAPAEYESATDWIRS